MSGKMQPLFDLRIGPERRLVLVGWVPDPKPIEMTKCSKAHCYEDVPNVGLAPMCPTHGGARV